MTTTIARPALGQRCTISKTAYKHNVYPGNGNKRTEWIKTPWKQQPVEAMYIGWRTVYSGTTFYYGDYDREFKRDGNYIVWVFVADERENPFYAFPEDVEVNHAD